MTDAPLHTDGQMAVTCSALLAWRVEIDSSSCIVFATTKAKAQWIATKSYWDAGYGRHKVWPRAKAFRVPSHDQSALRFKQQRAWIEDYVNSYPRQANIVEEAGRRDPHGIIFSQDNPDAESDAAIMCAALNVAAKERDAVKNYATISEQVN